MVPPQTPEFIDGGEQEHSHFENEDNFFLLRYGFVESPKNTSHYFISALSSLLYINCHDFQNLNRAEVHERRSVKLEI